MAATKVRVVGVDRLERTLRAAGKEIGQLKALHGEVGGLVARGAEPKAPRLSGALASTIRSSGTERAGVVRAGGAAVPYAGVQEFGWPERRIPASPFLTTSLAESEPEIVDMYERHADRVLASVKGS